jgi:hypothetical protein
MNKEKHYTEVQIYVGSKNYLRLYGKGAQRKLGKKFNLKLCPKYRNL